MQTGKRIGRRSNTQNRGQKAWRPRASLMRLARQLDKLPAHALALMADTWELLAPHLAKYQIGTIDPSDPAALKPYSHTARLVPLLAVLDPSQLADLERALCGAILDNTLTGSGLRAKGVLRLEVFKPDDLTKIMPAPRPAAPAPCKPQDDQGDADEDDVRHDRDDGDGYDGWLDNPSPGRRH